MSKKWAYLLVALSSIAVMFVFCWTRHDISFDAEKWKNWEESETTMFLRWDMTNDLMKKHDLKGMTVEEVINLLGEPEHQDESQIRYYLGYARVNLLGIYTGSLILTLDNNKVVKLEKWSG